MFFNVVEHRNVGQEPKTWLHQAPGTVRMERCFSGRWQPFPPYPSPHHPSILSRLTVNTMTLTLSSALPLVLLWGPGLFHNPNICQCTACATAQRQGLWVHHPGPDEGQLVVSIQWGQVPSARHISQSMLCLLSSGSVYSPGPSHVLGHSDVGISTFP